MNEFLKSIGADEEFCIWTVGKSWQEIFQTCHRGDWLLWLYSKTNSEDLRRITLAKAHCANTVRHLMKDKRSKNAVDVAIKYGNYKASRLELSSASDNAFNASVDASDKYNPAKNALSNEDYCSGSDEYSKYQPEIAAAAAAHYASDYSFNADAAAYSAADAAWADATSDAVSDGCGSFLYFPQENQKLIADIKQQNQNLTANICRKYLPFEIWNINNIY